MIGWALLIIGACLVVWNAKNPFAVAGAMIVFLGASILHGVGK